MGSDNSPRKERYLSKDEIKKETDNFIIDIFQKYKNFEGVLSQNDFNRIANGLINNSTINIIFRFCSSKNDKLTKNDFLYFFALLKTKSFDAKINFLLYFVFEENIIIKKETYISLVNKYYKNSLLLIKIFLDNNIVDEEIVEKEKVIKFILNSFSI